MAIQTMTIGEALDKGYGDFIIGAEQAKREEATFSETATSIGLEIIPAILGSFAGPKGAIAGSALGNYFSQQYRIGRGLQEEFGPGEFVASTALGGVALGVPAKAGMVGKTAIRAGQGAGLATGELVARTTIDEGRAPTRDEIATTLLFGGVFGGTLGAAEAKWMTNNLGAEFKEGMTKPDTIETLGKKIEESGGPENYKVGTPLAEKINIENIKNIRNSTEVAEKILEATENKILQEADDRINLLARQSPEQLTDESADIKKAFDEETARQNEIFAKQRETQLGIQRLGDNEEIARIKERIKILDHRLGRGKGAKAERARLNGDLKRIYKRNGMNLLDLQDDMRRAQMAPTDPPVGMRDRPMKQADPMTKEDRMAEGFLGKGYEKYFSTAFTTGTGAVGVASMFTEDEENEMKQAGFNPLMFAVLASAGFGPKAFRKFKKTPTYKKTQAQVKAKPAQNTPDAVADVKVRSAEKNPYEAPSKLQEVYDDTKEIVSNALVPLSRKLKNIGSFLAAEFRNHERLVNRNTVKYMDRATPFITTMTKRLKGNEQKQQEFKLHLLNGDMDKVTLMLDELKVSEKTMQEFAEMQKTLEEIRTYAREQGGIEVGYLEGYFPRLLKNYKAFRGALQGEEANKVNKALDEYAVENGYENASLIPIEEAEIVTSKVLRGFPIKKGESLPGNFKQRQIGRITDERMVAAYADPADALKNYIERAVSATERRKFLYGKPDPQGAQVGFEGSRDRIGLDLGMNIEVDDSLAGAVARRLTKDRNDLSNEDIEKLQEIIQSRFSGGTVDPAIMGLKNLNYIQVMGNFGSAITQLGDLAYSIYFNGFGNTFQSLFNQKDNFNFVKYFNLADRDIDAVTSSGGLSKALDKVFTVTGLKKLDQLGKNTTMNAAWKKYKSQAMKKGGAKVLQDDLTPVFGKEKAGQMIKELQESNPNSKELPKGVEELIWYKFLDLSPATLGEMPKYYTESGNMRIMYMLKSFTVKQFDVFREAAQKDIDRAKLLKAKGDNQGAAKAAGDAMTKIIGLGLVFGAANAGTDVMKDMLYGRPIKRDELLENNIWRLLGINRYLVMKGKREGPAKAVLEGIFPPTAVFDRAWQDISAIVGDGEYKGAMLQGTPLDMIYWRYLGGLDKIERDK